MKKEKINWKKLREELADIEHQRWSDWQKYVHSKCFIAEHNENGLVCWCNPKIEMMENANNVVVHNNCLIIPEWAVDQWQRQIKTSYKDLSEKEKESDREQVKRYLPLLKSFIAAQKQQSFEEGRKNENKRTKDLLFSCYPPDMENFFTMTHDQAYRLLQKFGKLINQ